MSVSNTSTFKVKLLRLAKPGRADLWTFLVLPKTASDKLSRRGRTSVKYAERGAAADRSHCAIGRRPQHLA